uniref:Equilibrative nucleoside transporter 1 n=2 Tax=Callorhinchus milii TaxID=7868 RepID=V9KJC8_CALMI|eukprot:gi/632960783/ref/XP_007896396.1/ PREDICTED: equilibrative nucleoside transporter 1 [Callorhinchus milii]
MTMKQEPRDRFNAVWLIFLILGLGTLLPWNFFMTAIGYFKHRLQDEIDPNLTLNGTQPLEENYLQGIFGNVMTLCAMLPLLIFSCLNSILHERIPQAVRINGSLIAIFLLFLLTSVLVKINMNPTTFFIITMVTIISVNSFGAVLQGSVFGLAGLLPTYYTTPIMSGQGMAGTFAALALICAIASGSEQTNSAFGYFITACGVILIAILAYLGLPRLEYAQHHFRKERSNHTAPTETSDEADAKFNFLPKDGTHDTEKVPSISLMDKEEEAEQSENVPVIAIFKKLWLMALLVCFTFTVTIGVFPAVTVDVKSIVSPKGTWGLYFIPIGCFLFFNVFDWVGRSLTAIFMWPGHNSRLLPVLVLCRVLFVPLFMLCNVWPRRLPVFFAHDAWFIVFMIFFSFSNGYLASLCMCYGPKKVSPKEAETAGTIMSFFLSLGLALGAVLSFLFRAMI